ncbi:MAG TPA: T9SS type A sorting domain-containing protein [Candidatus Cloacimonadota bacterium]|nr:T9SS type A sorting domain-containing protein [Candidatus Cloacimonadota bacterium]
MKKFVWLVALIFSFSLLLAQNAWINELHYDDTGVDINEFVEVIIENSSSYSLSDFAIVLYNGNGGTVYGSYLLDTFTEGTTYGTFTIYSRLIAGIQNGAPDGLCLSYQSTLITGQFLSYEGTITATDGVANGVTSTDMGVFEDGNDLEGNSLQLAGSSLNYSGFTWQAPATSTMGTINNSQFFGGPAPLSLSSTSRQYTVPTSAQTCDVQCDVTGGTSPYTVLIKYDVNGVAQSDITMSNTSGDTYVGTIPALSDGDRVEYYVEATDSATEAVVTSSTYGLFWGVSPLSSASGCIREIDADGVLVYDGYYCTVTGIATVNNGVFQTSNLEVYLQDAFGGINLFKYSDTTTITEGNSYTVTGVLDQYNGKTEIVPDDTATQIVDNGFYAVLDCNVKTITELLLSAENLENTLIGIMHVSKDSGTWGANQNLIISDGSGATLTLRIDGDTDLDENPEPTWPKDIVGIFTQYDSSSPFDSDYQIFPRSFADIQNDGTLPVVLSSFTGVCTNGIPTLHWTTQSEIENSGWYIYRSDSAEGWDAGNIIQCNTEMIEGMGTTSQATNYSYPDIYDIVEGDTYYYWLQSVSISSAVELYGPVSILVEIEEEPIIVPDLPEMTSLNANYPNPFNPTTFIKFDIKEGETGNLTIYNVLGQKVLSRDYEAGYHNFAWNADQQASGVYFYSLRTPSYSQTQKMLLMK